jgi:peptidoglycan/xylan/chitin deacetylase (PgdA/CDA1 family)
VSLHRVRARAAHAPIVLMYHRVLPASDWNASWSHPAIIVTPQTFARHMQVVTEHFTALTLDEFAAVPGRRDGGKPRCLVTFDDGWADNYEHAWPVLRRFGVPATIFLPVDYIDTARMFWQERLGAVLWEIASRARTDGEFRVRVGPVLRRWSLNLALTGDSDPRRSVIDAVRAQKAAPDVDPTAMTTELTALVADRPISNTADKFLTWAQIKEMASGKISFGGHGAAHHILTAVPPGTAAQDIARSADVLRNHLGAQPLAFAYPNGNWSPDVIGHVQSAGYRLAFTTPQHPAAGPFAIRRVGIHEHVTSSESLLYARLAGLL